MEWRPITKRYEETAIILDFLPAGYAEEGKPLRVQEPVAQAIGETYFTLLELLPKPGVHLHPHERVNIGKEKRDKIEHVKRRLSYNELTATAKIELPYVVEDIIKANEPRFIDFFNNSKPITTRYHQLELLPGIGKKIMWDIINERQKGPFTSFKDLHERVPNVPDPTKMLVRRVIMELERKDKYLLFVRRKPRREERTTP
ncbi:MAG: DUF655 domain-containing protein [Methanobacteriota archaeon]|nr:MAG: DUF655 domain-containing protein [Euryarchaeota archaeon]